VLGLSNRLRLE